MDAIPSYTLLDAGNGLLQEDIIRVGDETGSAGVLVTYIASVDARIDMENRACSLPDDTRQVLRRAENLILRATHRRAPLRRRDAPAEPRP